MLRLSVGVGRGKPSAKSPCWGGSPKACFLGGRGANYASAACSYPHVIASGRALRAADPFLFSTPEESDTQLVSLRHAGLRLDSFAELMEGGPPVGGTATGTIDDGCVNTLELAVPVLGKHRVPAMQYFVAGRLGRRNDWDLPKEDAPERLMSVAQIREWIAAVHGVGSHTVTHRDPKTLSLPEAREEIFGSKKTLEDLLGVPVLHFCFPYDGWRLQAIRDLGVEAGYQSACTRRFGLAMPEQDRWRMPRISSLTSQWLIQKAWQLCPTKDAWPVSYHVHAGTEASRNLAQRRPRNSFCSLVRPNSA